MPMESCRCKERPKAGFWESLVDPDRDPSPGAGLETPEAAVVPFIVTVDVPSASMLEVVLLRGIWCGCLSDMPFCGAEDGESSGDWIPSPDAAGGGGDDMPSSIALLFCAWCPW